MSSVEPADTTTTTTTTVQEQVIEAVLATMGVESSPPPPPPPPPVVVQPTPAATFDGDIRELVASGTLTVQALELFLSSACRWYYDGGYATFLWAQEKGLVPVPTNDLDIMVEPGRLRTVLDMMFGADSTSVSTYAGGYKVTLFEAGSGAFENLVRLGTAWVISDVLISERYSLIEEILSRKKLNRVPASETPVRDEIPELSTDAAGGQVDQAKRDKRKTRVGQLNHGRPAPTSKVRVKKKDNG